MAGVENPNTILRNSSGTEIATNANPVRTDPTGATTQPVSVSGTPAINQTQVASNPVDVGSGASSTGTQRVILSTDQSVVPVSDNGGSLTVDVATLPLPSGASTSALQVTGNTSLSSIDGKTPTLVSGRVPVDGSGVTQPVSGTVTANIGTSGSLATEASLVQLTLAQGSTTSGQLGSLTLGAVTTAAPTYTTGQTNALSITTAGALRTDGSATTQPVSGTVTANAGTNLNTSALFLDATATGGSARTKVTDGTNNAAVKAGSTAVTATDPALVVAVSPNLAVTTTDNLKATYSAAALNVNVAATPTDVFTIYGSSSKTVKVLRIGFSGTQTAGGIIDVTLTKRSTADSGGTSTTRTLGAHDSTSATGTAVVRAYTANPTTGTVVAALRTEKVFVAATTAATDRIVWDFTGPTAQPITLRGTGEGLVVNFNSVTITGNAFNFFVTFTEE